MSFTGSNFKVRQADVNN